jgi:hypothetical protein
MKTFFRIYLTLFGFSVFFATLFAIGANTRHDLGEWADTTYHWEGTTLYIDGWIGHTEARYILRQNPMQLRTLVLNSKGGKMSAGERIAVFLRDNNVTTKVLNGSKCYSTCTIVFQGGATRIAEPQAHFLYHAPFLMAKQTVWSIKWEYMLPKISIKTTAHKVFYPEFAKAMITKLNGHDLSMDFLKNLSLANSDDIRGTVKELHDLYGDFGMITNHVS